MKFNRWSRIFPELPCQRMNGSRHCGPELDSGEATSHEREDENTKGFTLVEVMVVIIILSIVSTITLFFLVNSLRIYTMTVNQKTLLDEGKLALERMCRDLRD